MRLADSDLLPKSRSLVEGLSDALTGYLTYRARAAPLAALASESLQRPVNEVAAHEGWMVSRNVPVLVGPTPAQPAFVDFVLRHEPRNTDKMSQCVLLQVVLNHDPVIEPIDADLEIRALVELRVRLVSRDTEIRAVSGHPDSRTPGLWMGCPLLLR